MIVQKLLGLVLILVGGLSEANATNQTFTNPTLDNIGNPTCYYSDCLPWDRIIPIAGAESEIAFCTGLNWTYVSSVIDTDTTARRIDFYLNQFQKWFYTNPTTGYFSEIVCDIPPPQTETWSTWNTIIINNTKPDTLSEDYITDVYIMVLTIITIFIWVRFFLILK